MTMRESGADKSRRVRVHSLRQDALTALVACLALGVPGPVRTAHAQALPNAAANQLHAAIVNGDVEALGYWLSARHADPNAVTDQEPSLTPLARCLALAGRVLDEPAGEGKPSASNPAKANASVANTSGPGSPEVPGSAPAAAVPGLRVVQDMVTLLYEHGARLTEADRRHTSGPVLRWYDDAVSRPAPGASPVVAPVRTAPPVAAVDPVQTPATTSTPPAPATPPVAAARAKRSPVTISPDQRKTCNGSGHRVYLLNTTVMPITATVTTSKDAAAGSTPVTTRDTYSVEPLNGWELGCDTSPNGSAVRYELNGWK